MTGENTHQELSESEKEGLRAAAKIVLLENKLDEIQEATEMLEIRFSVETSINEEQYSKKKALNQKKATETTKQLEKLQTTKRKVPLLALVDEGRQLRGKREKLTDLLREKKITDPTFAKMDTEYQMKAEEVEESVARELLRLEKIKKYLNTVPYKLKLEETFARKAVGELDEAEYNKIVSKLKTEQAESYDLLKGIESLLELFQ